jgi:hypothetical protein
VVDVKVPIHENRLAWSASIKRFAFETDRMNTSARFHVGASKVAGSLFRGWIGSGHEGRVGKAVGWRRIEDPPGQWQRMTLHEI